MVLHVIKKILKGLIKKDIFVSYQIIHLRNNSTYCACFIPKLTSPRGLFLVDLLVAQTDNLPLQRSQA